jgi:predicted N-acyltransferase
MELALPEHWQSMQDYEKSLKHKYAQRFRKVRQSWAGLDIRELSADDVSAKAAEIYALYMQVTENQSVRMGLLSEDFIPVLKRFYGDDLKVWGIYENGRMIAFASGWVQEASFDMFYIGFDYERNSALQLYFNILFFAIEQAIALKKPRLILGRTALEAKARVGCRPEYLNTFLHIRNPLLRNIVGRLQSKLGESGNEWEQRHPFKPGATAIKD